LTKDYRTVTKKKTTQKVEKLLFPFVVLEKFLMGTMEKFLKIVLRLRKVCYEFQEREN
jgi:hypothetical protein